MMPPLFSAICLGDADGAAPRGLRALLLVLATACGVVSPAAAAQAYDAAFVGLTVPSQIEIFKPASVTLTMRNTGTAGWRAADGDVFLATQEPQDNYYWCIQDNPHGSFSGNRVQLPNDVAPGEEVTFAFVVKPLTCGFAATAPFRFRMLSQRFGTFGAETPDATTVVTTASEFVAQQVPVKVPAGARFSVSVTFRNTTDVTWQPADGYALAPVPATSTTWVAAPIPLASSVQPGGTATFAFTADAPATAGAYNFQWQMTGASNAPFGQASRATAITVVAAGPANYQGPWWADPAGSEAGWGIGLAHQGNVIFATWFTYDATGKGLWLAMTANLDVTGAYTGALLQSVGPPFATGASASQAVRSIVVGNGSLAFDDAGHGTFAYTLQGISRTKPIVREAFGTLPICTFGLEPDLTLAYNYQDLWWGSPAGTQSGWGLGIAHEGDVVFGTWFTYDLDGTAMWLAFTGTRVQGAATPTYSGALYRTTGPSFAAVPFTPTAVVATSVGTASVAFTNGNAGVFAFTVNGVTGSKAITRQIFESPGTICQ